MSSHTYAKKPVYPLLGVAASVSVLVLGLLFAKSLAVFYFFGAAWLLFFCMGYRRACIAVLTAALLLGAVFAAATYLISRNVPAALAAVARITAVCLAVTPGLGMPPSYLVRSLSALKLPRVLVLGMLITFSFVPLLRKEAAQVREAMKTRGAGSIFNPSIFYRALLIPLIVRIASISDTLALSVETRGFTLDNTPYTVYKPVSPGAKDIIFTAGFAVCIVLLVLHL